MKKSIFNVLLVATSLSLMGTASAMQDLEDLGKAEGCPQAASVSLDERCGYGGNALGCLVGCVGNNSYSRSNPEKFMGALEFLLKAGQKLPENIREQLKENAADRKQDDFFSKIDDMLRKYGQL